MMPGRKNSDENLRLHDGPLTAALRAALPRVREPAARSDLLFLERWELAPQPGTALALRVQQIRRANPELAAAIRAEASDRPNG